MIIDAILKLAPNAEVSVNAEDIDQITWLDGNPLNITKEQIQEKLVEIQAEWDSQEYARKRAVLYPDIGDQLDALYHAGVFPEDMAAKLKKVKDDNPKSG